jgi:nucleoside-diphosphate-sugar epimerase
MKIIGNGLLANSFRKNEVNENLIIFASGVSNSNETRESEFYREQEKILTCTQYPEINKLVYFSTTSIDKKEPSQYTKHKQKMEDLVCDNFKNYTIYRLPQVVGIVNNTTLVSHFINKIINSELITIQKNVTRNLIDVDDVSRIVIQLNDEKYWYSNNKIINLATNTNPTVESILIKISLILGKNLNFTTIDAIQNESVDVSYLLGLIKGDMIFEKNYWERVLDKYVNEIQNYIENQEKYTKI